MIVWTLLLACWGKDEPVDDSADTQPPEQVWPDQDRVLFFYGMGGRPGSSSGDASTDQAQAWIEEAYGWPTSSRDTLGEPENFRAILMMDPGANEGGFSQGQVDNLQVAMEQGTRVVIFANQQTCNGDVANGLVEALGAPMRLNGDVRSGVAILPATSGYQPTDGVTEVYFPDPCVVETNGADPLVAEGRDVYAAAYRPAYGGDVVLIGDYNWMDDTGRLTTSDNTALLGNLVEVEPGF
ncbi:MAG: hypothetical protein H6739_21440 [Alphaproteobacteria bacterium]|nr:hypothetical protein [Alphaproteobacteria bacterium]